MTLEVSVRSNRASVLTKWQLSISWDMFCRSAMLLARSCVLSAPLLQSLAGPGALVLVWLFNLP